MNINHSFDPAFSKLMQDLYDNCDEDLLKLEGIHPDQLDINNFTRSFFTASKKGKTTADVSIDANANVSGKDAITFAYELSKPISRLNSLYNIWLKMRELYGEEQANMTIKAQVLGSIYINDAWDVGRPYCFNFSTYDIALEGLKMSNHLQVDPPKSLATFLRQVEQFVVYAANSTLGATGLADLLIVVSGYVSEIYRTSYDGHIYIGITRPNVEKFVYEQLTSLVYTLNWEFRGNQSAFTNVSIYDTPFLRQLIDSYVVLGQPVDINICRDVQRIFCRVMDDILDRTPITFPVTTACFSIDEEENGTRTIKDPAFLEEVSKANLKHGFMNIYMGKSSTLSSCCRLRSDVADLGYTNSFGSGSTKIGSLGVVTINLPQCAMFAITDKGEYETEYDAFISAVSGAAVIAARVNNAKREFLKDRISRGALPLYDLGYMDLNRQYSTCGITGLYEALEMLGYPYDDEYKDEWLEAAEEVLETIQNVNKVMKKQLGTPHNMEQVPAETAAAKLATKDRILGWNMFYELYSNQFLPLTSDASLFDRLKVQGTLDKYCDGGSVLHINAAQPLADKEQMKALIQNACEKGVVYFAINYVLCKCAKGHVFVSSKGNEEEFCPVCGADITDEYTRVVGFLTNTKHWNKTRREHDYPNRYFYQAR